MATIHAAVRSSGSKSSTATSQKIKEFGGYCLCTKTPPVPFRRVLPSKLTVPSLVCSVASLSTCPGGYLPNQHSLQNTGRAGCQVARDTSATWSGPHARGLRLPHLLFHSDRCQLSFHDLATPAPSAPEGALHAYFKDLGARRASHAGCRIAWGALCNCKSRAGPCLSCRSQCHLGEWPPRFGGNPATKRRQCDLAAARPWAQIARPIGAVPVRPASLGAFSTSYMPPVSWRGWRRDARNAEQNNTGSRARSVREMPLGRISPQRAAHLRFCQRTQVYTHVVVGAVKDDS